MRTYKDVACTICGCVCDDLSLEVDEGRIRSVTGACHLSESWFLDQDSQQPPAAMSHGHPVGIDSAIEQASDILSNSRWPLIYGLSRSSTDGQRAAVRLADAIGGNVDTTASLCHGSSIMAIQEVGESTCSLGEIRNRADMVIFWGVDPVNSHPRHLERYSVDPPGQFVPNGRADRTVVVIDSERTETAELADVFLQVPDGRHFELAWTLRGLLRGITPPAESEQPFDLQQLSGLTDRMKRCKCGVFFFGLGLARQRTGHREVEALLRLTRDLNAHTRFHARRMRMHGDVAGADSVLCWQTGFPFGVNLTRGYPRYNPGEFTANAMLERGEVDACLLVGSESLPDMSDRARLHLERIPTVLLEYPTAEPRIQPTVQFTTAVYGIHLPGTAYRMDEVPIPLRHVLSSDYHSDEDILKRIMARLQATSVRE
ncbi:formylmethanofuran dehydrogenase subunit B [Planctomycetota bacterium]